MDKDQAIARLRELEGKDLHELAKKYKISVIKNGKVNKGWAGHVCERHIGIPLNSSQSPNMGSWELKTIPLKYLKSGKLTIKETMAITMIDATYVRQTKFDESHMLAKLNKAVVVARIVGENDASDPSYVYSVTEIILDDEMYAATKADYDLVRRVLLADPINGFKELKSEMGVYIQPRTKGTGHGSTTRAFYARPKFLKKFIRL